MIDHPFDEYYFFAIRQRRKMFQNQVAPKLGISGQFLGRIERNEVHLPPTLVEKVADIYGVAPQSIIDFRTRQFKFEFTNKVKKGA